MTQSGNPSRNEAAPLVVAQGLSKVFKDFWLRDRVVAVDRIDFDVRPGEIFGLLGPNGSGKSTTIKLILGLLRPTAGRISLFGRHPEDTQVKNRIGYLPEESYLYRFLNARETLDFYGRLYYQSAKQRRQRIDTLLEMVGLQYAWRRPVGQYSKGMQRKIGLAQALINDPELLILDEPTTGMDPLGIRQTKELITTLRRMGKTVLLCSHQLAEIEDICDRIAIMYGGSIQAMGTSEELLTVRDETILRADTLDQETIQEVEAVLAGRGMKLRAVEHPRQKLETVFDRVIEDAQSKGLATSGAVGGGAIASFLVGEGDAALTEEERQSRDVLGALVAPATPAAEGPPPGDEDDVAAQKRAGAGEDEPPGQEASAVLDQLVDAEDASTQGPTTGEEPGAAVEEADKAPRSAAAPVEDDADLEVIEGLVRPGPDDVPAESEAKPAEPEAKRPPVEEADQQPESDSPPESQPRDQTPLDSESRPEPITRMRSDDADHQHEATELPRTIAHDHVDVHEDADVEAREPEPSPTPEDQPEPEQRPEARAPTEPAPAPGTESERREPEGDPIIDALVRDADDEPDQDTTPRAGADDQSTDRDAESSEGRIMRRLDIGSDDGDGAEDDQRPANINPASDDSAALPADGDEAPASSASEPDRESRDASHAGSNHRDQAPEGGLSSLYGEVPPYKPEYHSDHDADGESKSDEGDGSIEPKPKRDEVADSSFTRFLDEAESEGGKQDRSGGAADGGKK
ncbi:MAG: ATP-binding cassette domain-containing protein [Phycisphaeraceae bacterium]|nr:ATP-binding cassette domain-containing protein [Phycisphaeraceae bacterium]